MIGSVGVIVGHVREAVRLVYVVVVENIDAVDILLMNGLRIELSSFVLRKRH